MELLDHGADPNGRDPQGRTPLMLVSLLGEYEMVKLLIRAKADVHATDLQMRTALSYAKEYKQKTVIQVLEKAGAKF
jgi:ankyrin repeat protein